MGRKKYSIDREHLEGRCFTKQLVVLFAKISPYRISRRTKDGEFGMIHPLRQGYWRSLGSWNAFFFNCSSNAGNHCSDCQASPSPKTSSFYYCYWTCVSWALGSNFLLCRLRLLKKTWSDQQSDHELELTKNYTQKNLQSWWCQSCKSYKSTRPSSPRIRVKHIPGPIKTMWNKSHVPNKYTKNN